jgi:hypothetical protein
VLNFLFLIQKKNVFKFFKEIREKNIERTLIMMSFLFLSAKIICLSKMIDVSVWFDEQRRIEFARRLEDEFDIATYVEYLQKNKRAHTYVYIYCKLKQARTAAAHRLISIVGG